MALVLVLLFIVLPIAEIYAIIKVGEAIGDVADHRAADP